MSLNLSTLGKKFSRHFRIFFLFFPENRFCHYMQIVSYGDNLHVMSKPVFREKYYHCFWKRNCKTLATMPQVPPIKENLSNLLELASDSVCCSVYIFSTGGPRVRNHNRHNPCTCVRSSSFVCHFLLCVRLPCFRQVRRRKWWLIMCDCARSG